MDGFLLCLSFCVLFSISAFLHVFVINWHSTNWVDSTIASLTPLFSWLKGAPPGINSSSRQQKKKLFSTHSSRCPTDAYFTQVVSHYQRIFWGPLPHTSPLRWHSGQYPPHFMESDAVHVCDSQPSPWFFCRQLRRSFVAPHSQRYTLPPNQ